MISVNIRYYDGSYNNGYQILLMTIVKKNHHNIWVIVLYFYSRVFTQGFGVIYYKKRIIYNR